MPDPAAGDAAAAAPRTRAQTRGRKARRRDEPSSTDELPALQEDDPAVNLCWLRDAAALADAKTGAVLQRNAAFAALAPERADATLWDALGLSGAPPRVSADEAHSSKSLIRGRWHDVRVSLPRAGLLLAEVRDVHESELARERYHAILETSFDGFWDWKLKEDWEYMSPQFWRMFGYEPEEKEHKPSAWQDMVDPDDLQEAIANLGKHVASHGAHPYYQKVRYRHKQGHMVTVLCKGRVVEWEEGTGEALRMIGTHTDITLLDRKEQQLRAQTAEFSAVVNQTGVPVIAVDTCGAVLEWNAAVELLTGRARRDMVGRPLEEALADPAGMLQLLTLMRDPEHASAQDTHQEEGGEKEDQQQQQPPQQPDAEAAAPAAAAPAGAEGAGTRAALALSLRGPKGAPVDFIATLLARRDAAGGSWRGALLVGSDMTDVLASKTALVAERERADAEAGLNEYIAHEVRNPLTVAMSATRFLSSSLPLASFADANVQRGFSEDLNLLFNSLVYINELLANMLDLNRFAGGSSSAKLEPAPMSLRDDVLHPVRAMLNRSMSGVALRVFCEAPLWVCADALRLKQIVVNLAKNAIKFVTAGFINLSARRDPAGRFGPHTVVLSVEDSGPGVPASHRGTLFHKYQESLDRLRQGTGIGLSLCKVLATAMGGDIRHDPDYDSGVPGCPGSRFVVELPLPPFEAPEAVDGTDRGVSTSSGVSCASSAGSAGSDARGSAHKQQQQQLLLQQHAADAGVVLPLQASDEAAVATLFRGARCLVVDDESLVRAVLRRRLHSMLGPDAHVDEAATGEQALELLAAGDADRYQLILSDHYLPGPAEARNGAEFIRDARAAGARSAVVLGYSADDVSAAHTRAGADAFLRKPLPGDAGLARVLVDAAHVPDALRLLVVDDERLNRVVLRRLLATFAPRAQVLEAASAEEAREIMSPRTGAAPSEGPVDAVFLDEHLGAGQSGSALAAALRRELGGDTPVLVRISAGNAHADAEAAAKAASGDAAAPFDLLWNKPFPSVPAMKATLLRALQDRASARRRAPRAAAEPMEVA